MKREDCWLVFAHVPPPLHGQSKMVREDLGILREELGERVFHVDARWSESLEEIGASGWGKLRKLVRYLWEATQRIRTDGANVLYYVPGPVKWSAVLRDIVVLGILRLLFPSVVFHWHAVGQGEWAHGSDRVFLTKRKWLDQLMRRASAMVLASPDLSIAVSSASDRDAVAVGSRRVVVVPNGISDPVLEPDLLVPRTAPPTRILFFSRGTVEKGIIDALDAVERCSKDFNWPRGRYTLTLAGGVDAEIEREVLQRMKACEEAGVLVERLEFVGGGQMAEMFQNHDLLFFPSHWESFGLVIVEALAFGLPVVAAASDGARGVLGDDYPYLAQVGDIEDLASVLGQAVQSVPEWQINRKLFTERYTLAEHRRAFRAILKD